VRYRDRMGILLQQLVKTRGGFFSFGTRPSVIELHDDERFVIFAIDKQTHMRMETLMDVPLDSLRVRKQGTLLIFKSGPVTRRVEFSDGSENIGFAAGGLVGMAIATAAAAPRTGILTWIDALRTHRVKVATPVVSKGFLVILAVPVVLTLALLVAVALSSIGR